MINVKDSQCEEPDCFTRPNFDFSGGKGRYCAKHKKSGMIDVRHIHCEESKCTTRVYYGVPGQKRSHCAQHRKPGMIRRPNGKCIVKKCKEPAIYGGSNYIPFRCETHKEEDDLNLVERECVSCGFTMVLDKTNHCEHCNPENFKQVALAKQNAIMEYLDTVKGLPPPFSTDRMIDGGSCGRERPDRVYDFGSFVVVMECDEHQHSERACECEQTRMINIGQSFGGVPVYFVRWNPDNYEPLCQTKHCEPIKKRNKLLGEFLFGIANKKVDLPNALVSVIYLYYDEWDGLANEQWEILTPFEHTANGSSSNCV
jgi:hypothetical protein